MAEHCTVMGHLFHATKVLSKVQGFWERVIYESLEIHLDHINHDIGLQLCVVWKLATGLLNYLLTV